MNPFPFTPRNYQLETRFDTNELLNRKRHPLIVMPAGSGKSKTAAMIIFDRIALGEIVYMVVPVVEIFDQLLLDYSFLNPGYINDEGIRGTSRKLYVCMAMSLVNNLPIIPESLYPNTIVTDECHHSAASTWQSIYSFFGTAQRVGMTATPLRIDKKPLGDLYTDLVEKITIKKALDCGYLTKPIVVIPDEWKLKIPMKNDDYDTVKQAEILGEPQIIGDVIKYYEHILCGLPTLVACSTHAHAQLMTREFNQAGWAAEHIHSKLTKYERKSMLNKVRNEELNILCTVGVGYEGLDLPNLYGLIWLRRTTSPTIWVQFNGRPMRLAEGKNNCVIIDPIGNTIIHGMPDRVRIWDLKKGELEDSQEDLLPYQTCPNCGVYNAAENIVCHWCGYDLTFIPQEGTCMKCKNWRVDKVDPQNSYCRSGIQNPHWLIAPGCEFFSLKGRQLPTIIDGKLVAITTDGQIHEIKEKIKSKKKEMEQKIASREEKMKSLETIDNAEKRKILKANMFSNNNRRELFKDALDGMI